MKGTNSPSGIGRASAHQYAHNGAKAIFICDYASNHLETHKRELNSLYPSVDVHVRTFDAGNEAAVKAVCEEAVATYGRLDIIFANAGILGTPKPFWEIESDDFMKTMKTNALGVFLCAKHAAIAMQKTSQDKPYPGGSIIGTASVAGLRSNAGSTDYSASKAAVVSLAQTMSYQLSGDRRQDKCHLSRCYRDRHDSRHVRRLLVRRGQRRKSGNSIPCEGVQLRMRWLAVALFLGSDEASYVNGQAWAVCGGLSAGHPFVPGKLA